VIGKPPKKAVAKKAKGKAIPPSPSTPSTKSKNPRERAAGKPVGTPSRPKNTKKKQDLNIRERRFIKGLMEGLTPTEAMRQAGYAENTALYKHGEKLRKVKPTIEELMDKRGLTDDRLLDVLDKGLDATKNISCNVIINATKDANEQDAMRPAHEMTKDFVEVEDYPTRHKYLETGLKLRGHLQKTEVSLGNPDGSPLQVNVTFVSVANNANH
jgi:phage terminase small subunit